MSGRVGKKRKEVVQVRVGGLSRAKTTRRASEEAVKWRSLTYEMEAEEERIPADENRGGQVGTNER